MQINLTAKGRKADGSPVLIDPSAVSQLGTWDREDEMLTGEQSRGTLYALPEVTVPWRWRVYINEEPSAAIRKFLRTTGRNSELSLPSGRLTTAGAQQLFGKVEGLEEVELEMGRYQVEGYRVEKPGSATSPAWANPILPLAVGALLVLPLLLEIPAFQDWSIVPFGIVTVWLLAALIRRFGSGGPEKQNWKDAWGDDPAPDGVVVLKPGS